MLLPRPGREFEVLRDNWALRQEIPIPGDPSESCSPPARESGEGGNQYQHSKTCHVYSRLPDPVRLEKDHLYKQEPDWKNNGRFLSQAGGKSKQDCRDDPPL